ncbi:MAG: hypothetical protein JWR69_2731 [Pedosphaera sp.]|nr:hypothetical protein [Pedosphaera sp.]
MSIVETLVSRPLVPGQKKNRDELKLPASYPAWRQDASCMKAVRVCFAPCRKTSYFN